ncbi:hypothetical protein [Actinocrinis sp.]|uniref:hypothetical protein n=1 Tax=Actinocrinis sp. TaxID=1920516 RepID=UPI002D6B8901|nr:hypothetical protein [Actinocrinis sp.]HZP54915.1 hypothetical protein [Actinocrinis sp.]
MATMMNETSAVKPPRTGTASLVLVPQFWGAVAIVAMWFAVLFDGVYGGDFVSADGTRMPSAIFIAFFAALSTWAVARRAFGRSSAD